MTDRERLLQKLYPAWGAARKRSRVARANFAAANAKYLRFYPFENLFARYRAARDEREAAETANNAAFHAVRGMKPRNPQQRAGIHTSPQRISR